MIEINAIAFQSTTSVECRKWVINGRLVRQTERNLQALKRELGRLVVDTTAKVTGKVLNAEDQKRLQEEAARQVA